MLSSVVDIIVSDDMPKIISSSLLIARKNGEIFAVKACKSFSFTSAVHSDSWQAWSKYIQ